MSLINKTLDEALEELRDKIYRIVSIDGKGLIITCDFVSERLNLVIVDNKIVEVYNG